MRIRAGSPAIHIFAVDFLSRVTRGGLRIPFHLARKKVPCLDENGNLVQPAEENALKLSKANSQLAKKNMHHHTMGSSGYKGKVPQWKKEIE